MNFIILLFIVTFFLLFISFNYFKPNKLFVFFSFGFFFPLFILMLRSYKQPDFENYMLIYDEVSNLGGWFVLFSNIEPLFIGMLKLFSLMGVDYYFVANCILFFVCIIFSLSAISYCRDDARECFILAFLFFSSYYFPFLSLNVVRQGLAVAFFALGFSSYMRADKVAILFFVIAALCHYSAVLPILSLFIASFIMHRFSYRLAVLVIFISFLFGFFDLFNIVPLPDVISLRIDKLKDYDSSGVSSLAKLSVYFFFFVIYSGVAFYLRRVETKIFFFNAVYLCLVLVFLRYGELLDRLIMYSLVFGAFLNLSLYKLLQPKLMAYVIYFIYCSLSFVVVMLSPSTKGFLL